MFYFSFSFFLSLCFIILIHITVEERCEKGDACESQYDLGNSRFQLLIIVCHPDFHASKFISPLVSLHFITTFVRK